MQRRNSLLDDLLALPWWLNLILAAFCYFFLQYYVPTIHFQSPLFQGIAKALPGLSHVAAGLLVFIAALSAFHSWRKGELLNRQTGVNSLKKLSWKDFEFLVSEAFRREGYDVRENPGNGPDGGVDLVLQKAGKTTLVQCKQWNTRRVGVSVIRELLGVMTAEGADEGIVVCSGDYTKEARDFARGKPLQLINGEGLVRLIGQVQKTSQVQEPMMTNACPVCGSAMVMRTAKRGRNSGQKFLGCSRFPQCRGTRVI